MSKKYLIVIFALIFTAVSTSHAGSWNGWVYQSHYPTKNTLLAVKFITPKKGWLAGEHGTILYTEDGGENWEEQESGIEQDIKSISFVNEKIGWMVGNGGVIIHTEDGGKRWERQGYISYSLHTVFFSNEIAGWAGGDGGTLLNTKDGGKTWNKQDIETWSDIAGIFFLNPSAGWVLSGGSVYRTKDGGKTWESSKLPAVKFPGPQGIVMPAEHGWQGSIYFVNEKKGWATVGLRHIFSTEDGGKTWQANQVPNSVGRISFTDEKNGCMAGTSIFCTEDGGKTWKERLGARPGEQDVIQGFPVSIWGLSFADKSTAWAVGNDGQVWKTEDAGKGWRIKSRGYDVFAYFLDSTTGWNIEYDYKHDKSSIVKTEDGGATWKVQKAFESRVDGRFFFINPTTGWAVGQEIVQDRYKGPLILNYFILHTSDGGKTWITQFKEPGGEMGISNQLIDLFFINSDTGWVVGYNGMILHTKDSGRHWKRQKSNTKLHVTDVRFFDKQNGMAIADNRIAVNDYVNTIPKGVILCTDDGGQHWRKVWEKKIVNLDNLFLIEKNNVWIAGEIPNGVLLIYTIDGSKTWKEKSIEDVSLEASWFLDKDRGVILTEKGQMLITRDGGTIWDKQRAPIRRYPWHVSELFDKNR